MMEQITPPVSGSVFAIAAIYTAVSLLITGPEIGRRTIEKQNWSGRCETQVVRSVRQQKPDLQSVPKLPDCNSFMGAFAGPDSTALCGLFQPLLENPLLNEVEAQNRKLMSAYRNRVAGAAATAKSKCSCAANVVLEQRVPWAIYAGSLRGIEPSEVRNLDARLKAALSSPVCSGQFDGRNK